MTDLPLHLGAVEAVTFDAWGTLLVDADPAATHSALVRLVAKHGNDEAPARAALDMAWTRHYVSWSDGLASGAFDLANETLRLLGPADERAATDLAAAFSAQVLEAEIHAIDGARETLRFLCDRGLRLGLVCDTGFATGAVVRQLLDREGLGEWLEVQIYSDEWGVPKPHPRVFLAAIAALDVPAERAVHVGDLLRTDVAGARAVGMGTVRITAAYDDPTGLPEADLVVASHAALRRAFDAASAGPRRRVSPASLVPHSLPDDEDRLDRRIREGRLEGDQLDAVASRLAERHRTARCDEETSFPGTVEKLSTEIRRLTESLRGKGEEPGWLPEVEGFLTDFLLRHADRLRERVLAKRVLAIHGHLAASAVSVSDDGTRVRLADPFSTPLGAAYGDAVRDIVDLYGELRGAGFCRHADRFVSAYAEAALDFRLYGILGFHTRLQALRRRVWYGAVASSAMTAALGERGAAEASEAERQLAAPLRKREEPLLVVTTGGWVGTGKSTVSLAAARVLGAPRIEVDRISTSVIDDPPVEPVRAEGGWAREADWERNFAPGFTDAVYAEFFRQARLVTESGRSVVLDGCFGLRRLREAACRMANEGEARFVFLECRLDRDLHRRRIAERERRRGSDPGTWAELAADFERVWEPTTELGGPDHHLIDTSRDVGLTRSKVADLLADLLEGASSASRSTANQEERSQ